MIKSLKEIELSLSDIASGESSLEVGKKTGALILLAWSITESSEGFTELIGWIHGKTPCGDSLTFNMDTRGINLGISISF